MAAALIAGIASLAPVNGPSLHSKWVQHNPMQAHTPGIELVHPKPSITRSISSSCSWADCVLWNIKLLHNYSSGCRNSELKSFKHVTIPEQ
jgi:hypothetical protein